MKNLPIQFVEFRGRKDDFLTEGGGKDVLQRWIQDDIDICREQSSRVYNQMNSCYHCYLRWNCIKKQKLNHIVETSTQFLTRLAKEMCSE